MFTSTLQGPYLDKMVRSASSGFSDFVVADERIENFLKSWKIQGVVTTTSNGAKDPYVGFNKNKERQVNVALISKGMGKDFKVPYYQVAEAAPSPYQQQAFAIPTSKQHIPYQP